jgi:hypothetical protein
MNRSATVFAWAVTAALLVTLFPTNASAIPAFARKYGLKCSACHEAWPVLNDFGRAFRDNGYQLLEGRDNPTTTPQAYIPVSVRITPNYQYMAASHQQTDQGSTTLKSGGFQTIGLDLLMGGTLFDNVSFLVVPTGFTTADGIFLESAWVRFDNLMQSSWLNLLVGRHEVDLPRSAHRPWNLSPTGYLLYSYHSPGSASLYDLGENQSGVQWVGHDRGSLTRASVSVFNVEETPGSRNAFNTPGVYAHVTKQWLVERTGLSAVQIGGFGSYTTWPTSSLTLNNQPISGQGGDLKPSSKFGVDSQFWLGPTVTPFHVFLTFAHGKDDKALITNATRDGTFNGGFLEVGYTPRIKTTIFGRYDVVRNQTQGVPDNPTDLNDQDAQTIGIRHTLNFTSRSEYALHAEFSTMRTKRGATDGSNLRNTTVFLGIDFAY